MSTLAHLRDSGDRIILYCAALRRDLNRWCNTSWEPGLDQMIQYFGLDFEIHADRARFLAMFECPNCGAPAYTLTYMVNASGMMHDMGSHNHGRPDPIETARIRAELEQGRAIAEMHQANADAMRQEALAAEKARKKLQRDLETGRQIIGPPNPWKYRKGPKPPMRG